MVLRFDHPHDSSARLLVTPAADVFVDGASVASSDFSGASVADASIAVPADSGGVIQIRAALRLESRKGLNGLLDLPITERHTFIANWRYHKSAGRVRISTANMAAHGSWRMQPNFGPARWYRVTPVQDYDTDGTAVRLGLVWDSMTSRYDPMDNLNTVTNQDGRMEIFLTLSTARVVPSVVAGEPSIRRQFLLGPFQTGRTELEQGTLLQSVRAWFNSLPADLRNRIERAQSADQMPASRQILIEGYASTAGDMGENDVLA